MQWQIFKQHPTGATQSLEKTLFDSADLHVTVGTLQAAYYGIWLSLLFYLKLSTLKLSGPDDSILEERDIPSFLLEQHVLEIVFFNVFLGLLLARFKSKIVVLVPT